MADTLLLTGADGYVGQRLAERLGRHVEVIGISRSGTRGIRCELMDEGALDDVARSVSPRWIVHAAGNKDIAACERTPMLAYDANVRTAMNLLRAWPDVPMFYLSSDYVFPGTRGYYGESSPVSPTTTYGRSKLCAEVTGTLTAPGRFTAVRVSALYDASAKFLTFLDTELRAGRPVDCYIDSFYSPTYVDDFASAMLSLLSTPNRPEVIHIAGERISRFEFARKFANAMGFDASLIRPVPLDRVNTTLCSDLSLSTILASERFDYSPTPHDAALRRIARGVNHADADTLSPVLRFEGANARGRERRAVGRDQLHRDRRVLHAWGSLSS